MGRDKLSMSVGGVSLIRHSYDTLARKCEEVLVVASQGPPRSYGMPARPVLDLRPGRRGPLAAMEAGLSAARNRRVFVAAGDAPFVPEKLVGSFLDRLSEAGVRAVVPRYGGRVHPLCAAYERDLLVDLSFALNIGVSAVKDFLANVEGVRYVEDELESFGDPEVFLMNVNSPEDLARARSLFSGLPDAEQ